MVRFGFGRPFNRTSLELKQRRRAKDTDTQRPLLIAPVWNWNGQNAHAPKRRRQAFNRTSLELKLFFACLVFALCVLLIAPVWNWNAVPLLGFVGSRFLLIAPVWNWNVRGKVLPASADDAFNRTSLELKRISPTAKHPSQEALLIAPVWNWNRRWGVHLRWWVSPF